MFIQFAHVRPVLDYLARQAVDHPLWIVGGTVRDALLERPLHDVDLAVHGSATQLARQTADALNLAFVPLDAAHDVARIVIDPHNYVDLAGLRAASIEADLRARDVTANALAIPLLPDGSLGELLDPLNGQADIAARRLRACSATVLVDDPARILRVVRFAATLGWQIDAELHRLIQAAAPLITFVAAERLTSELLAILAQRWSAPALAYLRTVGVLFRLLPELEPTYQHAQPGHIFDVWEHLLEAVCCGDWVIAELFETRSPEPPHFPTAADDPWPPAFFNHPAAVRVHPQFQLELQWQAQVRNHMRQAVGTLNRAALWKLAILLHDVAKPTTRIDHANGRVTFHEHQIVGADMARSMCQRLKLSRAAQDYVWKIVRGHMRPGQLTQQAETTARAAWRFFRDLEPAAVDTLLHSLIDHLATQGQLTSAPGWAAHLAWTDAMLGFHWDSQERAAQPLIDGHTLMQALDLKPGPQIGTLLEAIQEAHAAAEIATQAEALALARRLHAQL